MVRFAPRFQRPRRYNICVIENQNYPKPPAALAVPIASADLEIREPRKAIRAASSMGYRAVQLDVATPGLRPRDLDRSGRRDLAAALRRLDLHLAGVDLWIPSAHFIDPANAERALSAVEQAIAHVAELCTLVGSSPLGASAGRLVCLNFPKSLLSDSLAHLTATAAKHGVRLADHTWPSAHATLEGAIAQGIDPAAVLSANLDPISAIAAATTGIAAARLTDSSELGRVIPGSRQGRLDLDAYAASLVVRGFRGCVVVDTRGLVDPDRGAREAISAWSGSRK